MSQDLLNKTALALGNKLHSKKLLLATAESCTGGWIAKILTDNSGSSEIFDCGFVTYSNAAKEQMLGVKRKTLEKYGAVSEETARAMAEGALKHSEADISLAVTGIAGPNGGTAEKPVGLVWFAWAGKDFPTFALSQYFNGDRNEIRRAAVVFALNKLLEKLMKSE